MNIILLISAIIFVVLAIKIKDLLKASIALAGFSIALSMIFFRYDSPYAAVFELAICSGLITVLFVSAISMLKEE